MVDTQSIDTSDDRVARIARGMSVTVERAPPYLTNLLAVLDELERVRGVMPCHITRIEAAWEHREEDDQECGFVVSYASGQQAYLQGVTSLSSGRTTVTLQPLAKNGGWRDAAAGPGARAAGWSEDPEEVNAFLQAISGEPEG